MYSACLLDPEPRPDKVELLETLTEVGGYVEGRCGGGTDEQDCAFLLVGFVGFVPERT
jgi:hypothetical protein